jgi:hypothetical protein
LFAEAYAGILMQIDRDGNRVLLQVLAEIEVFSTIDLLFETKHPYVEGVQRLGIPYRPAIWFGGPLSGSRRKAISRATTKLAVRGLVKRMTQNRRDRVTHLRLTRAGFRRAIDLAGEFDLGQMVESLARIDWADPLWNVLDELASPVA